MEEKELFYLATKAFEKGWTFDQLYYCDDLYGKEHLAEDVQEYIDELKSVGRIEMQKRYPDFEMY